MRGVRNLRQFIEILQREDELVIVDAEVDPCLEIAEIHRRVAAADGPAILFRRVKGSTFPVVTNLFGSDRRLSLAFHNEPERVVDDLIALATREFPPSVSKVWKKRKSISALLGIGQRRHRRAPVLERAMGSVDLEALPLLKSWPEDGGSFITLPLVYTEPPGGGPPNLGMYRIHRYDKETTGLHWQIAKGGGFHYHLAEQQGRPLPVSIFIGGPPALILSAITPLPENVPELLAASLLQGGKLSVGHDAESPYPLIAEAEFALLGEAPPNERRPEGPFGDHYGFYSWAHDFPVFRCRRVFHRKDAIYPATVVGKPRQEDFYIGNYLQDLLSPLFPVVMPSVKALWSYGETGFHSLGAAVVQERYYRESMASAFRILGEGQLSLTKFLLLTDQSVDVRDFRAVLTTVLERFRPETDLFVFANLSLDTLDYTGPELNKGSRGIMIGTGDPVRDLPGEYQGEIPSPLSDIAVFSPGCLVLEAPQYREGDDLQSLCSHEGFKRWPLLVVVDSIAKATKDLPSFLWTVFTRFEPAADIYAGESSVIRHHLCYEGPILIDARHKPSYPPEVLCDDQTSALVTQRWKTYFRDGGVPMGDSVGAHVC